MSCHQTKVVLFGTNPNLKSYFQAMRRFNPSFFVYIRDCRGVSVQILIPKFWVFTNDFRPKRIAFNSSMLMFCLLFRGGETAPHPFREASVVIFIDQGTFAKLLARWVTLLSHQCTSAVPRGEITINLSKSPFDFGRARFLSSSKNLEWFPPKRTHEAH